MIQDENSTGAAFLGIIVPAKSLVFNKGFYVIWLLISRIPREKKPDPWRASSPSASQAKITAARWERDHLCIRDKFVDGWGGPHPSAEYSRRSSTLDIRKLLNEKKCQHRCLPGCREPRLSLLIRGRILKEYVDLRIEISPDRLDNRIIIDQKEFKEKEKICSRKS
jgi:hypothetical protein